MYNLSNTSKKRLEGVLPLLVETIEEAISHPDCPDDFGIPQFGGRRTTEDQQGLYAIGRTIEMGRKPVTYVDGVNKKSNHQPKEDGYGHAVDIYIYDHATKRASWNVERLTAVARHIQKIGEKKGLVISWGGDWNSFKDYPHMEVKKIIPKEKIQKINENER